MSEIPAVTEPEHRGAVLTIDLDAITANWRLLGGRLKGAALAGVVKADAYGLGMEPVAAALAAAGCRAFFVAHAGEGMALRRLLPEVDIHIFNGIAGGGAEDMAEGRLIPVLNSLGDIDAWRELAGGLGKTLAADIHVDTGMSRLGLPPDEWEVLTADGERLAGIAVAFLMSHLACADEPEHPLNRRQLETFGRAVEELPGTPASLANSSGIFLGTDYHFDLARPGAALYGINPCPGKPNPMAQVIRLQGKILQVREIDSPQTVGYGATHRAGGRELIATVDVGYADGYLRSLSNRGGGFFGDVRAPLVGRVSMDLVTFDVSEVPEHLSRPGSMVDLIGPGHTPGLTVDDVAADAGTIGYEILTSLGSRYHRVHRGGG